MQAAVYSDEKVFGPEILDHVEVKISQKGGVMVYEMGNLALAFKHPGHTKEWNCGSVLGVGFIQTIKNYYQKNKCIYQCFCKR